jgi:hypothetical protein
VRDVDEIAWPSPHRMRARPRTMYRTVSRSPWWCGPVFAFGWTTTVPAQSLLAPVRACVMAAARVMPGVWGVLGSRSPAATIFTPSCCQSIIYTIAGSCRGVIGGPIPGSSAGIA